MPTNKHKRKASSHVKAKSVKSSKVFGLVTSHPKAFICFGMLFVVFALYLLTFKSQDNAMFGLAMLSLLTGIVTTFYANIALPKKKAN